MKRAKFSTNALIAALSLGAIFAASVFLTNPAVVASVRVGEPMGIKPVKGIDVIVKKKPGNTAARTTKTNDEGRFTVGKLEAGQYDIRLECKECERTISGDPHVYVTLTGTSERNFNRTITKRQLVAGVAFTVELQGQVGGQVNQEVK